MPVSDLHRQVAGVALRAAARYGFALGGGNVLIAHGVIDRPTADVDLFTDREHGVAAAADAVEAALRQAGYSAERQDKTAGLSEVFEGMGEGLAEWIITTPDGAADAPDGLLRPRPPAGPHGIRSRARPGRRDRRQGRRPGQPGRRTRLHRCRRRPRRGYSVGQLTVLALALDPGLAAEGFADAGQRLDRLRDDRFAPTA
jgi:hypothetical protein